MRFIDDIKERARRDKMNIVLPETNDPRTIIAAHKIIKEDIATVTLIGDKNRILENAKSNRLEVEKANFIEPDEFEMLDEYVEKFVEIRKKHGVTPEQARHILLSNYLYFGCMMVKMGAADGMVAGACHSSADVLRSALQVLKTRPGTKLVSAFFLMEIPDCQYGSNGTFVFADAGLNQNPNPEELAAIAASSAQSFATLVKKEPIVAMISHSTKGSASHPDVDKVVEATRIAKEENPDLLVDGEFQVDAAIVPEVARLKAPESKIAGRANVLVFPDLDCGNNGYKLVQRLAKADAYGPITQGLAAPVNDLSRGCIADDIVGVVAITAVQAQQLKKDKAKREALNSNVTYNNSKYEI
ncbi:MAG: phosphate acetyltransferase [Lachnospiraceae bacterium]|nr:phosphate acetyltransferase [Lachnospiraceae bacterium]